MTIQVKYLTEETIETDAEALLTEFSHARGVTLEPPIPIEDIVEKHLKLRVEFDDLHEVLGVPMVGPEPEIFGALWVDRREIWIHETWTQRSGPKLRDVIALHLPTKAVATGDSTGPTLSPIRRRDRYSANPRSPR